MVATDARRFFRPGRQYFPSWFWGGFAGAVALNKAAIATEVEPSEMRCLAAIWDLDER